MASLLNLYKLLIFVFIVLDALCGCVVSKPCSNKNNLAAHTLRQGILSSKNETWKKEMLAKLYDNDEEAWFNLHPRKMLRDNEEANWVKVHDDIKDQISMFAEERAGILKEVSLHDVRLVPDSLHWNAQQTNLEYLLMLDNDNLLWSFRNTSGSPNPGHPYGGWESPGEELRGHFVGHYMSAAAKTWASTYNETLKEKMSGLVSALSECQQKMGTGYLSAFPSVLFDRYELLGGVWAPYYTIHKIMAGLLDQYTIAGNEEAFQMVKWMVDYFYNRVRNVIKTYSIERHYRAMNEETGGMNDVLYYLYSITGDPKHLWLAHLFDKPCFLGILATKANYIGDFHTNTHVPIVIGAQRRYEITGDPLYREMATFFMDIVNSSHAYATGGTSENEHWRDPKRLGSQLTTRTEESCTTYNMLKVSRNLFRWTKDMAYADYYERALTNGVLSIQRGREPGRMIYFLPLEPGSSKVRTETSWHVHLGWGTQFNTFWCCYGTGIESFSKLGDSIYFEEEGRVPGLYIIQYIESSINWKSGGLSLTQIIEPVVSWDDRLRVTLTINSSDPPFEGSTLNLRIPTWANGDGAKASLNDQTLSLPHAGNFLTITRRWNTGDKLTLELPMSLRTERISDDRPEYNSIQAVLYGPYLLAGLTFGEWEFTTNPGKSPTNWMHPIAEDYNSNLITLSQVLGNTTFVLSGTSISESITMANFPEAGTDEAANSTFRLIPEGGALAHLSKVTGKLVQLEPYNLPGTFLVYQGENITIAPNDRGKSSLFRMQDGLDGNTGSISLESENQKGCYIYTQLKDAKQSGTGVKLMCNASSSDADFKQAVSFKLEEGISKYHPISFIAKGKNRSFLLSPLLSLRDESYTVYFNFTTSAV